MGYLTSYSQSALVEIWRNNLCSCLCSDNRSDVMLLRGSVFFIGMCLWGSQRVPNLKYSSSTVLPSMLQVGISSYYTAFKNTVDLLLSTESHPRFCWFSSYSSPLRLPRLAFAICGWRWQNNLHEIKYSVCHSPQTLIGLKKFTPFR